MPLDAQIPLMAQGIELNSPLNMLARATGVQNMLQQNRLQGMQMQDMHEQRAMQLEQAQARQQFLANLPDPPADAPEHVRMAWPLAKAGLIPMEKLFEAMKPQAPIAGDKPLLDPKTMKPVYTPPGKPAPPPDPNKPFSIVDGQVVPNVQYQNYQRSLKERPAGGGGASAAPATVQPPKLKQGERWNPSEERVEVVPGSDLYQKQSSAHAKDDAALRGVETKMDTAIQKIQGLLDPKNKDAFESNFGGYNAYATQYLPGATSDARKTIESIKSDLKAAGLEMMRSGGSIGQMTQQEWPIVERMIATIDPVLGEEKAREEFGKIVAYMEAIKSNARKVYETDWGGTQFAQKAAAQDGAKPGGEPVKVNSIQDAQKLAPGTVFIDPNGVRRVR